MLPAYRDIGARNSFYKALAFVNGQDGCQRLLPVPLYWLV
jgi:hypothetical protein